MKRQSVHERLNMAGHPGWLTAAEVGDLFNVTTATARNWIRSGKLPGGFLTPSGRTIVRKDVVEDLLKAGVDVDAQPESDYTLRGARRLESLRDVEGGAAAISTTAGESAIGGARYEPPVFDNTVLPGRPKAKREASA